jgi:hypothetical protein
MNHSNNFYQSEPTQNFNLNTTHPLIPSSQEYVQYKKYVSIHSEDRDILKYPNSNTFEIELPEDLLNVVSLRLVDWTFPSNYDTFSSSNSNVTMSFKITNPYNPGANGLSDDLVDAIFAALFTTLDNNYTITIEDGFYNPIQMVTELTNKFNESVTNRISTYLLNNSLTDLLNEFNALGGYTNFIVVYNNVSQKVWFGNKCDGFVLTNQTQFSDTFVNHFCNIQQQTNDFSNWGLPGNIGLNRNNIESVSISGFTPRFYYGDVFVGDNGYWLTPTSYPGANVYYIECPFKINLLGPSCFYMEIEGQNCIDETSPYNISSFTLRTNETNGVVNSSFAKIAIPSTPNSQWFDRDSPPYKLYMPPAERMRKFKFKLRYHNEELVNFGTTNYTFTLEFVLLQPQQLRKVTTFNGSYNKNYIQ